MIECVPNFSEGRNPQIIGDIVWAIESVPGVNVLYTDMGYDAHRTVITFVGDAEACKEAAFRSILRACQLIDMSLHQGAHPRLGAVDVFPFVPLQNSTMQQALECAFELAQRVASELELPVYLYNESALVKSRKSLAYIRKGEYEGLREKLSLPEGKPDFGPSVFKPRTGATIIGARKILIAFNLNLNTKDVAIAKKIAFDLREKNGGLKSVRAIGWLMPHFDCVQVSTNLTDMMEAPLHFAFETCQTIARKYGVEVAGSELVGMIPLKALTDAAEYFNPNQNLEEDKKVSMAIDKLGLNSVKAFDPKKQIIEWALR